MRVHFYYYDITKNNKQIKNYSLSWDNYQLGVASRSRSRNERAEVMATNLMSWSNGLWRAKKWTSKERKLSFAWSWAGVSFGDWWLSRGGPDFTWQKWLECEAKRQLFVDHLRKCPEREEKTNKRECFFMWEARFILLMLGGGGS